MRLSELGCRFGEKTSTHLYDLDDSDLIITTAAFDGSTHAVSTNTLLQIVLHPISYLDSKASVLLYSLSCTNTHHLMLLTYCTRPVDNIFLLSTGFRFPFIYLHQKRLAHRIDISHSDVHVCLWLVYLV